MSCLAHSAPRCHIVRSHWQQSQFQLALFQFFHRCAAPCENNYFVQSFGVLVTLGTSNIFCHQKFVERCRGHIDHLLLKNTCQKQQRSDKKLPCETARVTTCTRVVVLSRVYSYRFCRNIKLLVSFSGSSSISSLTILPILGFKTFNIFCNSTRRL